MGTLQASGDDVKRWMAERRWDILKYAYVLGREDDPFADLWVKPNGDEAERCPFVRKDANKSTYRCLIYETRPEVCRNYEPWAEHSVCVELDAAEHAEQTDIGTEEGKMGYTLAASPCFGCGRTIYYNPMRVPSVVIKGSRKPICPACVIRVNPMRLANGLEPIIPLPDAYEPCDESEL
jgi:Fe-S-cluster containining protein